MRVDGAVVGTGIVVDGLGVGAGVGGAGVGAGVGHSAIGGNSLKRVVKQPVVKLSFGGIAQDGNEIPSVLLAMRSGIIH